MKRAQSSTWIAIVLASLAGTSLADVKRAVHEPKVSGTRALAVEARDLSIECQQFLAIPADSTSEILPWAQRLSVAACRQSLTLAPVDNPERFPALVEALDRAMEPSLAIYRDAATRGPVQVKLLAMYGMGMTGVNIIVRARSAVRIDHRSQGAHGGAEYGATYGDRDRALALRRLLELQLRRDRDAALGAFREVARLADEHPEAARANVVMTTIVADARAQVARLH